MITELTTVLTAYKARRAFHKLFRNACNGTVCAVKGASIKVLGYWHWIVLGAHTTYTAVMMFMGR